MRYKIEINLFALHQMKSKLSLEEAVLLDYLYWLCCSPSEEVDKMRIEKDGKRYTWFDYGFYLQETPILKVKSKSTLTPKIKKLEDEDFIETILAHNEKGNKDEGLRKYVRLLPKCDELFRNLNRVVKKTKGGCSEKRTGLFGKTNEGCSEKRTYNNTIEDNNTIDNITASPLSVVNYFFELKGWNNKDKGFYEQNKIIYARFTRPAKELLGLCDNNLEEAKSCLKKIADWAISRDLDWGIETVFKKWYDLDLLKPKEKKPYYRGNRIFFMKGRKYVLMPNGDKFEFAGNTNEIIYK